MTRRIRFLFWLYDKVTAVSGRMLEVLMAGIGRETARAASEIFDVPAGLLTGRGVQGSRKVYLARWATWYVLHTSVGWPTTRIALHTGGFDPSTVSHGLRRIGLYLDGDPEYRGKVERLLGRVGG